MTRLQTTLHLYNKYIASMIKNESTGPDWDEFYTQLKALVASSPKRLRDFATLEDADNLKSNEQLNQENFVRFENIITSCIFLMPDLDLSNLMRAAKYLTGMIISPKDRYDCRTYLSECRIIEVDITDSQRILIDKSISELGPDSDVTQIQRVRDLIFAYLQEKENQSVKAAA